MPSDSCVRCPYDRPRRAKETRIFSLGERSEGTFRLRLCADHAGLFDRMFNTWIFATDFADTEAVVCVRCPHQRARKARHARHFMVGEESDELYFLRLCDADVERFDRDCNEWVRVAVLIPSSTRPSTESYFGDGSAQRIRELRERAAQRAKESNENVVPVPRSTAGQRDARLDKWRFTVHAQKRAEERGFSTEQVLNAAAYPVTILPVPTDREGREAVYHVSGECCTVVNPDTKEIITVFTKFEYLLRADTHAKGIA